MEDRRERTVYDNPWERHVLGSPDTPVGQVAATSDSCRDRRPGVPDHLPIVCVLGSTGDLIDRVATLDDAIRYADVSDVDNTTDVKKIGLDGHDATLGDIQAGYPFWTVEYLYSHGRPEPGSLPDAFTNYLLSPKARAPWKVFSTTRASAMFRTSAPTADPEQLIFVPPSNAATLSSHGSRRPEPAPPIICDPSEFTLDEIADLTDT